MPKEQGITWGKATLKQSSFQEVLWQHSLSAVEFGGIQLHAGSHPLCLLFPDEVLALAVKGRRTGADTMLRGWSCKDPGWAMAWSEQQSMGLTPSGGLAREERTGHD